jgi:energy-coupling factor transport system ATP-binding protein
LGPSPAPGYDEPTSGLDYRHMLDVAEAIREMKKADNTQFIITHDAELVSHCCDYIILMQSGKIIKQGSLMNQDINKAVREFWKQ